MQNRYCVFWFWLLFVSQVCKMAFLRVVKKVLFSLGERRSKMWFLTHSTLYNRGFLNMLGFFKRSLTEIWIWENNFAKCDSQPFEPICFWVCWNANLYSVFSSFLVIRGTFKKVDKEGFDKIHHFSFLRGRGVFWGFGAGGVEGSGYLT